MLLSCVFACHLETDWTLVRNMLSSLEREQQVVHFCTMLRCISQQCSQAIHSLELSWLKVASLQPYTEVSDTDDHLKVNQIWV